MAEIMETDSPFNSGEVDIKYCEIEKKVLISDGPNAQVWSGRCRQSEVAIKQIKRNFSAKEIEFLIEKLKSSRQSVAHPNLVLQMGVCFHSTTVYIVTDLLMQDLESLLFAKSESLPLQKRLTMAKDAAQGIQWLHSANIIPKNLKLRNFMVDSSYKVYVSDFLCYLFYQEREDITPPNQINRYTAPELSYSTKSDVYSYGVCLWEIITQKKSFDNFSPDTFDLVVQGIRPNLADIPPSNQTRQGSLSQLISSCWSQKPAERPSFSDIIPWLSSAIIAEAISIDESGRTFWEESHFATEVKWDEFRDKFSNYIKEKEKGELSKEDNDSLWKCLQALLVEKKSNFEVVTVDKFGRFLAWFGPLSNPWACVNLILSTLRSKWFHGDVSTEEFESKLNRSGKHSFLVRFSSLPGCFTISSIKDGQIINRRVQYTHNVGFIFGSKTYKNLKELISGEKQTYNWKKSCPDSKYNVFFTTSTKKLKTPKTSLSSLSYEEPKGDRKR